MTEATATEPPRRGLGIASLILGIAAVLGDVIIVLVIVDAVRSAVDINTGLQNLFVAAVTSVFIMIGGFIAATVGLILGIIAVSKGRGRVLGVIGMLLSILVVLSYILAIILVAAGGAGLETIATWV